MKVLKRIWKSRLVRNAGSLMIGTVLAQVIAFGALPFLTRLYDPAHFGLLGVFVALTGLLGKVLTMRYDNALVIPRQDVESWALLRAVNLWVLVAAGIASVAVYPWRHTLLGFFGAEELAPFYWFFPVVVVGQACLTMMTYWATRKDAFGAQSMAAVSGSCAGNGLKLALGSGGFGAIGLLAGTALQQWTQFILVWGRTRRLRPTGKPGLRDGWQQAVRYSSFPKYRMPQDVVNYIGTHLPNLALAAFFSPHIVGFYLLAHRILQVPLSILREAVRRALYRRFSEDQHADRNPYGICCEITLFMALVVVPPALAVIVFGGDLMAWVFGPEWAPAGPYLAWLMVALGSAFFNVPVVVLITLMEWNRFFLVYETAATLFRSAVLVAAAFFLSPVSTVAAFSIATALANIVLVAGVLTLLRRRSSKDSALQSEADNIAYSLK